MQQENQPNLFNDLSFDHTAKMHIRSIASWAMTVVVVAVIGYVISVFNTFAETSLSSSDSLYNQIMYSEDTAKIMSLVFVAIGLITNFFLYRFASQARSGLDSLNQQQLSKSFGNLRTYFMILSIILVIVFVVVVLGIVLFVTADRPL